MRIIAGEHRGRILTPPPPQPGDAHPARGEGVTRPITDRAKQSLFDVITPWLPDAVVADVFAGTGSMGLECLSRGSLKAYFYEADRAALKGLKENITKLRVEASSKVMAGDLFRLFDPPTSPPAASLDVIFLDPPYRFLRERPDDLLSLTEKLALALKDDGVISFRHDSADALDLPGLHVGRTLTYGSMTIHLLRKPH